MTVQKTSLLKYPQAWDSQNKFKKITANQNLLLSQLTWLKRLSYDTDIKSPQWQRH